MNQQQTAVLFYKPGCPPCRTLSKLVVVLSAGTIRRVGITDAEAEELYAKYPEQRGRLVLIDGDRVTFGRRVFLAVPSVIARTWMGVLR